MFDDEQTIALTTAFINNSLIVTCDSSRMEIFFFRDTLILFIINFLTASVKDRPCLYKGKYL